MADLNQFLNKDLTTDDVTGGGAYGLSSSSFDQRNKKKDETRVIGAYNRSILGSKHSSAMAKTVTQDANKVYDASSGQVTEGPSYGGNRQANTVQDAQVDRSVERRQHFIEPTPRNYDKYST